MATQYKGNTAVREAWESGQRTSANSDTIQQIKKGKYADLLGIMPAKGAELITGFEVVTARLVPRRGKMGELTIDLIQKQPPSGVSKPVGSLRSTIETDMVQLEKSILTKKGLSDGTPPKVELWRASSADLRAKFKYNEDGETYDLDEEAKKFAKLILKGTESYLAFYPVVSRTTIWAARKDPTNFGTINTPPVTVPGTWVYLKTADRCSQTSDKTYTQTEQWTGAEEWSTDLYETT